VRTGQNYVPVILVGFCHFIHKGKLGLLGTNFHAKGTDSIVLFGAKIVDVGEATGLGCQGHGRGQAQGDKVKGGFDSFWVLSVFHKVTLFDPLGQKRS